MSTFGEVMGGTRFFESGKHHVKLPQPVSFQEMFANAVKFIEGKAVPVFFGNQWVISFKKPETPVEEVKRFKTVNTGKAWLAELDRSYSLKNGGTVVNSIRLGNNWGFLETKR